MLNENGPFEKVVRVKTVKKYGFNILNVWLVLTKINYK